MFRFSIFILLFILSLVFACSTPSWFPIKKGPPHKAKMKELLDKEVVIIDREEYVKVTNPRASEGGDQPRYLYIPVNEYLSKAETFTPPVTRKEEVQKEFPVSSTLPSSPQVEKEVFSVSPSVTLPPNLKKKVVVAHFDDRATNGDEILGDWVAEKLTREISRRSQQILFVDYQIVRDLLERRGLLRTDLETPETLRWVNEALGIHALVVGQLSGPYVFTTKGSQDQATTASAIIRIEMKIVDTLSGKTQKNLSAHNPITASKEKGAFSEEKAKIKAIDLTLSDISRELSRELDRLNWFCRVAKVEGEEIYINAGKLTGLKVGDVMEVFQPGSSGEKEETKGRIKISGFLGIDASTGRLINGKKPEVNDILRPSTSKGT